MRYSSIEMYTLYEMLYCYCLYVCLCRAKPLRYVAIKFQKSAELYSEAAYNEIDFFKDIQKDEHREAWEKLNWSQGLEVTKRRITLGC